MATGLFVTGTDTGVGKTTIALGLMEALKKKGLKVVAMKPVSAGCIQSEEGLRNEDAVMLIRQASIELPYELVNPYAFEPPVAPHIAADEAGISIERELIRDCYDQIASNADVVIVEGAGGWLVPINGSETMADVAKFLSLDVITVVGIRLGCLNHALLTTMAIEGSGLKHRGWIANHIHESMLRAPENIQSLQHRINAPLLAEVKYGESDFISLENVVSDLK